MEQVTARVVGAKNLRRVGQQRPARRGEPAGRIPFELLQPRDPRRRRENRVGRGRDRVEVEREEGERHRDRERSDFQSDPARFAPRRQALERFHPARGQHRDREDNQDLGSREEGIVEKGQGTDLFEDPTAAVQGEGDRGGEGCRPEREEVAAPREEPDRRERCGDEPHAGRRFDVVVSRNPADTVVVRGPGRALIFRKEVEANVTERQGKGASHPFPQGLEAGRPDESSRGEDRRRQDCDRDREAKRQRGDGAPGASRLPRRAKHEVQAGRQRAVQDPVGKSRNDADPNARDRAGRSRSKARSTAERRSGNVTETDVCIQRPQTVCPVENAQVAAPAAAARSEKRRLRRKYKAARYAKLNFAKRIPVSIHASGRRKDGSATKGDRKPCAR